MEAKEQIRLLSDGAHYQIPRVALSPKLHEERDHVETLTFGEISAFKTMPGI